MLQMKPNCETCKKPLSPDSNDAYICSYECTFCEDCCTSAHLNICPNCGGNFEKRPLRKN